MSMSSNLIEKLKSLPRSSFTNHICGYEESSLIKLRVYVDEVEEIQTWRVVTVAGLDEDGQIERAMKSMQKAGEKAVPLLSFAV